MPCSWPSGRRGCRSPAGRARRSSSPHRTPPSSRRILPTFPLARRRSFCSSSSARTGGSNRRSPSRACPTTSLRRSSMPRSTPRAPLALRPPRATACRFGHASSTSSSCALRLSRPRSRRPQRGRSLRADPHDESARRRLCSNRSGARHHVVVAQRSGRRPRDPRAPRRRAAPAEQRNALGSSGLLRRPRRWRGPGKRRLPARIRSRPWVGNRDARRLDSHQHTDAHPGAGLRRRQFHHPRGRPQHPGARGSLRPAPGRRGDCRERVFRFGVERGYQAKATYGFLRAMAPRRRRRSTRHGRRDIRRLLAASDGRFRPGSRLEVRVRDGPICARPRAARPPARSGYRVRRSLRAGRRRAARRRRCGPARVLRLVSVAVRAQSVGRIVARDRRGRFRPRSRRWCAVRVAPWVIWTDFRARQNYTGNLETSQTPPHLSGLGDLFQTTNRETAAGLLSRMHRRPSASGLSSSSWANRASTPAWAKRTRPRASSSRRVWRPGIAASRAACRRSTSERRRFRRSPVQATSPFRGTARR